MDNDNIFNHGLFMIDLTYDNNLKFFFSLDHTHNVPYYGIICHSLSIKNYN